MGIEGFGGKLAFITGGASGIGLGIAKELLRRGARVVLADLRPDHLAEAQAELGPLYGAQRVLCLPLDVTDRLAYRAVAAQMEQEFGGIDILVNNAGVGLEGPILEATYADYDFGMGVNFGGVINGFVEFLPQMRAHGRGGHIVSTSSLAAEACVPERLAIYGASKAAVCHYCEAVKPALAEWNIGVSILLPGAVKSNIHKTKDNRPAQWRDGSGYKESEGKLAKRIVGENWMEAEEVGRLTAEGILANQTYIITHGFYKNLMQERADAVLSATPDRVEEAPDFARYTDE